MANTFPTATNNYATGTASAKLSVAGHAAEHNALEAKLGIDSSTVVTSIDYLLKNTASIDPGHKHTSASFSGITFPVGPIVGTTDTQTLTNKTLTTPILASFYQDVGKTQLMTVPNVASDTLVTLAAAQTLTNKTLTTPIIASISNTGTLTLPTSTDTLVGRATTDTLTNKTLTTPVIASFYQDAGLTKLMTTPNTASDTLAALAATQTFTNKRITKRESTITSSATPTPNGDTTDIFTVTALAAGATFAAPTGTPTQGQPLIIRIKDNASAQTLAWNVIYRASSDLALPTTTIISKTLYLGFIYNSTDSKWDLLALLNNF